MQLFSSFCVPDTKGFAGLHGLKAMETHDNRKLGFGVKSAKQFEKHLTVFKTLSDS